MYGTIERNMKYLLQFCIVVIFSLPALASAGSIIPCGDFFDDGTAQPPCQACHVVQLGQNLLTWFIAIMASVIALIFAIGGMKMVMSGGGEGVSAAKTMMTNSVIGFIILLSAYLFVDTLLKLFVDESKLGTWNEIQCVAQPSKTADVTPSGGVGTTDTTAECKDDAALISKYKGSPVGQEDPGLKTIIDCYLADTAVATAINPTILYTVDRSHPRCSLTNGDPVCGVCSHSANSCHYGRGHGTGAMAVDFNARSGITEAQLFSKLQARQPKCGGTLLMEGDHTHISMPGC